MAGKFRIFHEIAFEMSAKVVVIWKLDWGYGICFQVAKLVSAVGRRSQFLSMYLPELLRIFISDLFLKSKLPKRLKQKPYFMTYAQ